MTGKSSKAKGSKFEREFCSLLSLWWTGGKRDDVFYKTAGSGSRSTNRARKNITTPGHGDVGATDAVGIPFTDLVTVELKRGYNRCTIADILDLPENGKEPQFAQWIRKAKKTAKDAGTSYWMLVVRRDRKESVVYTCHSLLRHVADLSGTMPLMTISFADVDGVIHDVVCLLLSDFLRLTKPEKLMKHHK